MNSYKDEIMHLMSSSDALVGPSSSNHPTLAKSTTSKLTQLLDRKEEKIRMLTLLDMQFPHLETIWGDIMRDYYVERFQVELYRASKTAEQKNYQLPEGSTVEYMEKKVFSILFPALTETLMEAAKSKSLNGARCTFNGLDLIAQIMWNKNPNYPDRAIENLTIHDMPWAQKILEETPRPYFPKSWIYTPEIAAIKIQAFFRGYLVRKCTPVQELRDFWRTLQREKLDHCHIQNDTANISASSSINISD